MIRHATLQQGPEGPCLKTLKMLKDKGLKALVALLLLFSSPLAHASTTSSSYTLFGKTKYPDNFSHFNYTNPDAPKRGALRLAEVGTFDTLNQFTLKGIPASNLSLIYDSLMAPSEDELFSFYPLIAEKIEIDKSWVRFYLNPKAKWHDGESITSEDVAFTFDALTNHGHPNYKLIYKAVKNVKIISNRIIQFDISLKEDRNIIVSLAGLNILPKHYWKNKDFSATTLEPPLGSGPYKIKKIAVPSEIIYERDKNYWAKDLPVNNGRFNFQEIHSKYYLDDGVLRQAFNAGEFDFHNENISKFWQNGFNTKRLAEGKVTKIEQRHKIPVFMQSFVLNSRNKFLQNIELRRAMNWAFNFTWSNRMIFGNAYKRIYSFYQNSEFSFLNYPQSQKLQIDKFTQDPYLNTHVTSNDYYNLYKRLEYINEVKDNEMLAKLQRENILYAAKILKNAGYYIKNFKLHDPKNHEPVKIEFLLDSTSLMRAILPFKYELSKLGIESTIKTLDSGNYQRRLDRFNFDIIIMTMPYNFVPGTELFGYFHSSSATKIGGLNLTGTKSPMIDHLIEQINSSNNWEEIKSYCSTLDRILMNNYVVVPNWYLGAFRLIYDSKLHKPSTLPDYSTGLFSWWM